MQPIIRGIQSVGSVDILYRYNTSNNVLTLPDEISLGTSEKSINTSGGVPIAGFRLDGEFLRANPQIASSVVIPILGGGGVAITNNNRTGTLTFNCAKVSSPSGEANTTQTETDAQGVEHTVITGATGSMVHGTGFGPVDGSTVYDMVFIAQAQQAQAGGDSVGASIAVCFAFCGKTTIIQFDGCTVASVDPVALTGNDAASYNVAFNYLNWRVVYNKTASQMLD